MAPEYKRLLFERGLIPADCVVLHFRFNRNQNSFHFEIMEKKLTGYIYDSYEDGNVFVVLEKDDPQIEKLNNIAISLCGGYIPTAQLWLPKREGTHVSGEDCAGSICPPQSML